MRLLAVPAYKQQIDYSCGPACLKIVLAFFGKDIPEDEIAQKVGTKPNLGTAPNMLQAGAKAFGLVGRWKKGASINDLRKVVAQGTPVIVNWFSHDDGHYSVVVGVDDEHVVLLDPEDGKTHSFSHAVFMRVWFDFPSPHIRYRHHLRIRWMLPLAVKK